MARIALVTRNSMMGMGLSTAKIEVVEVRPENLDGWLAGGGDETVDALALDLGTPESARDVVGDLREAGRMVPVLLVASGTTGWGDPAITFLPNTEVLPLPVTTQRLVEAANRVLAYRTAPDGPAPEVEASELPGPAPTDQPVLEPVVEIESVPEPDWLAEEPTPEAEIVSLTVPLPAPPPTAVEAPPPPPPPVHEPKPKPKPEPVESLAPEPAPPAPTPPTVAFPDAQPAPDDHALVRQLLSAADMLYGVPETAAVVLGDALERVGADAGALFLPDGEVWRVSAGEGLRPLEFRLQLDADAWLVAQVALGGKGVIIEESDVARLPLRGVALASRRHLVAAPLPAVRGVLLLARDEEPGFDKSALAGLAALAREATPLVSHALDVRRLARRLGHFQDLE